MVAAWDTRPLTAYRPWRVSYVGEKPGIFAILSYHTAVPRDMLTTVLTGAMVSIVVVDDDLAFRPRVPDRPPEYVPHPPEHQDSQVWPPPYYPFQLPKDSSDGIAYIAPTAYTGTTTPLHPSYSQCIGHALIRGIDTDAKELHLLTPLPAAVLKRAMPEGNELMVLVHGKLDSPDWAYLEDVYRASTPGKAWERGSREREDGDRDTAVNANGYDNVTSTESDGVNTIAAWSEERPYVAVRRTDAGLGGSVWRVRHLPRRMQFGE